MYIEVLNDSDGTIFACCCADTLPEDPGMPMVRYESVPEGLERCRANIDTLTAMEIESGSGARAVVDAETGSPRIVSIERAQFIRENYRVDTSGELQFSPGALPAGMKVRRLIKKAE